MMKGKNYYFLTAVLCAMLLGSGCNKEKNPELIVEPPEVGINAPDTIRVAYNGTVPLSSFSFSITPEGTPGTLTYSIQQPLYADNGGDYEQVEAYKVENDALASVALRVPDAFVRREASYTSKDPETGESIEVGGAVLASRTVLEGKLKIALSGSAVTKEVVIIQTGKPKLEPEITLGDIENYTITDGPSGKLITLQTVGSPVDFKASWFKVEPIDFDLSDIRVGIGNDGGYITTNPNTLVPQAGGLNAADGTGGFVVAYHKDYDLQEVLANPELPQARLYINVDFVAENAVVGIEPHPSIGQCTGASFWRNTTQGRQNPSNFIVMVLNDGTKRAYDNGLDGAFGFLAGNFDNYLEGRTGENASHSGWWTYVALRANVDVPQVGTSVSFQITEKAENHFLKPGWTVTITTQTLAASPGVVCTYSE
jgi:hypothetical protein